MEPAGITFLLGLLVLWAQLPGAPGQDDGGKEGECPAGEVKAVPPSRVYCLSDRSCPGAEKCCSREHLRACLLPATVSPGYCPRSGPQEEGAGSCAASCSNDTACPGGQKCCVEGCCARCHCPEPAKPGVCPRKPASPDFAPCPSRCEDDRTCPGDEKCCFTGCGLGCVSPYKEKPEECPAVPTAQPKGPCLDACLDDSECPGDEKCCDTGCGHRCQAPHSVRPGLCPAPARKDEAEDCSLLCSQDSECPAGEKCCLLSCGRACVPPVVQEKPGRCRWTPHVCLGNVTAECHTDAECPGRRKCCLAGCARTCTPPETGVAPWTVRAATDWGGPRVRLGPSPARRQSAEAGRERDWVGAGPSLLLSPLQPPAFKVHGALMQGPCPSPCAVATDALSAKHRSSSPTTSGGHESHL
ncbi:WAP four-disulfide core domain protein 3 isoform X4 [Alligator mississippiensis]|uniref:WAP four-disulfide core domain protein 3 isoform X4 n=1 Tax=Alligator mississippiensis TaxID=8496 RepID=UPI0009070427|nr:WAP four-disulfide core domain protein 3 isoform X4 [Alligator mississippiensis]